MTETCSGLVRFHERHGENIALLEDRRRALRRASFDKALVFSERPLRAKEIFFLRIETTEDGWSGHLRVGVTSLTPQLGLDPHAHPRDLWLVAVSPSSSTPGASTLPTDVGSRIGIYFSDEDGERRLHLVLNQVHTLVEDLPPLPVDTPLYAAVDVFGATKEVRVAPLVVEVPRLSLLSERVLASLLGGDSRAVSLLPRPLRPLFHAPIAV